MRTVMLDQRHLFSLPEDESYLNGASRSPQLRSAAAAARGALNWREQNSGMPSRISLRPCGACVKPSPASSEPKTQTA